MSSAKSLRNSLHIFFTTLIFATLPLTAVISLTVYIFVYGLSCFIPNYGKFLNCFEVWLDEDFVNSVPQNSIVISLTLQGDLALNELRSIFSSNVLNARSNLNPNKHRYPELKQYLSSFMGFQIWKKDPSFLIENHVKEQIWNGLELASIHAEYLNKPFEKCRSPWEMVLIRNVNSSEGKPTSLLILRVHHVMADAKSLLKLLVECLGGKPLKTAKPQCIQRTCWDEFCFRFNFPWKYFRELYKFNKLFWGNLNHPWKLPVRLGNTENPTDKMVVAFSPIISLPVLKQVAIENNVKTSAVVMSIIVGAMKMYCGNSWKQDVAIGYPFPKPNHPEKLTNHLYLGTLCLPADQPSSLKRLQQCNDELVRANNEQQVRYDNIGTLLGGVQIYPISRITINAFYPTGISNNAGEEEGFSVGNAECIDYRMSVGTLRGMAGVVFCTISYKDGMRIAVIAKESILSKESANSLAKQVEFELQRLLKAPKL